MLYLSNRTHQIKINKNFNDTPDAEFAVPQGSALGPLLFNVDMIDLFYKCADSDVESYTDNATPYSCATGIPSVALELQTSTSKLFRWFKSNHSKANPEKCHILLRTNNP